MRILLISQWFTPEPTIKGLSFARALRVRGHEVEVLTGFPNYPGGRLYSGYKLAWHRLEVMDGVRIHRVALYPSHDTNALRRVANYASFAFSAAVIGLGVVERADVAYVYHPPAAIALPAAALRLLRGVPFVYDIQDLWPDTLAATKFVSNRALLRLVGVWCAATYRMAARIVVLSPGLKGRLVERGVPTEKVEVIYNWCDEDAIRPMSRDETLATDLGLSGKFNVIFAGTMGTAQGLDTVLAAAERLANDLPQVQFVFVGGGVDVERLQRGAKQLALGNVLFVPRQPFSAIGKILAHADALLVHLINDPLFRVTVPSKTQAYMAAGRPILMGVKGDAADLVREANAGICFEPEDPKELARAVRTLIAMPCQEREQLGRNGRSYYSSELAMARGLERFEKVFSDVVIERSGRQRGRRNHANM